MANTKIDNQIQLYYDFLKKTKGISDRTIYCYISTYYRHFVDQKLTQKNIDKFIESKNNSFMSRAFMKSYLEFLKRDKDFSLPKTKTGRSRKKIIRDISKKEVKVLINSAYSNNVRVGVLIDLLYWGALRRTEILTIKTNSFNWDKWFDKPDDYCPLKVTGKGKKDRIVFVHPNTVKEIMDQYLNRGLINNFMSKEDIIIKLSSIEDPLFSMGEWNIWRIVKKVSQEALKRKIRPHEIRHARATHMLEDGASVREIQRYLGHSSIAVTEIYLHTSEEQALNRLNTLPKDL